LSRLRRGANRPSRLSRRHLNLLRNRLRRGASPPSRPARRLRNRLLSQHRNRLRNPPRPSQRRNHGFSLPLPPPPPRRRRGRQRTAPRTRACPRGRRPIRPSARWSPWPAAWSWSSSNGPGTGPGSPRSTAGPAGSTPAGSCRGADTHLPRGGPNPRSTREAGALPASQAARLPSRARARRAYAYHAYRAAFQADRRRGAPDSRPAMAAACVPRMWQLPGDQPPPPRGAP